MRPILETPDLVHLLPYADHPHMRPEGVSTYAHAIMFQHLVEVGSGQYIRVYNRITQVLVS
jgi:hypothetical protein